MLNIGGLSVNVFFTSASTETGTFFWSIRAIRLYCSAGITICGIAFDGSVLRLPPIV